MGHLLPELHQIKHESCLPKKKTALGYHLIRYSQNAAVAVNITVISYIYKRVKTVLIGYNCLTHLSFQHQH